jgi:hypothetical protein
MILQRSYRLRTVTFCALIATALAGIACNAVSSSPTTAAAARGSDDDVAFLEVVEAGPAEPAEADSPPNARPFMRASQLLLTGSDAITARVPLTPAEHLVVYDLGPAEPGDCIVVKQLAAMQGYTRVAFFDGDYDLLGLGVFTDSAAARGRPVVCDVFAPAERLYVAIDMPAEFAPTNLELELTRDVHEGIDCDTEVSVVLNFAGTTIDRLGTRENVRVRPFLASDVCRDLNADTAELRQRIIEAVRRDFEPLGIAVHDACEMDMTAPGAMVAHIGPTDIANLGAASGAAVVNTTAFSFLERYNLSGGQVAQAIANVTSHEVGHLFGLNHTTKADDVMNVTGSALDLFVDQSLSCAPLDPAVFPIGMQDGRKWIEKYLACDR